MSARYPRIKGEARAREREKVGSGICTRMRAARVLGFNLRRGRAGLNAIYRGPGVFNYTRAFWEYNEAGG